MCNKLKPEKRSCTGGIARIKSLRLCWTLALFAAFAVICLAAVLWLGGAPPLDDAARYPCGVILRDAAGEVLRVGLGPDGEDCRPYYSASTNDWIVLALIAAEDRRFMQHRGVDFRAVARAAWQNLVFMRRVSGASTITMQSVRLIRPKGRRTLRRKALEAVQALRLELRMSKQEILSQYLNRAPFGSNLTGIEAGARGWFGKAPQELHLGEAALLAGMVQSPTRLRPDRKLKEALKRRAWVLQRMESLGLASSEQCAHAEKTELVFKRAPRPFKEPFFCDWAQRGLTPGDYRTTLDPQLQSLARGILDRSAHFHGCDGAVLALSVVDGAVRVWHCTGDYFARDAGQVNTVLTPRPAGSTLKPFAYALAIERGLLTPAYVLADVPRNFGNQRPVNFSGSFLGPVPAGEALIRSLNLPAIEVVEQCGLERFLALLRQLGITSLRKPARHYGLGLALGNGSVSLYELAQAYACLARGGETLDIQGRHRVLAEGACWMIAEMLGGEERAMDAVGHAADAADLPRFAWKTGTSSGFHDAWTVAWNPDWVVAVWCGHKSGRGGGDRHIGKKVAAPVVWDLARHLPAAGWYRRPADVEPRKVCAVSGCRPGPLCGKVVDDWSLRGHTLARVCAVHVPDGAGGARERWPQAVEEWLAARAREPDSQAAAPALRITAPADGSVYRVVEGLVSQAIVLAAAGAEGKGLLAWFRNDQLEGTEPTLCWQPQPGIHRFVCAAANGESDTITITVR